MLEIDMRPGHCRDSDRNRTATQETYLSSKTATDRFTCSVYVILGLEIYLIDSNFGERDHTG